MPLCTKLPKHLGAEKDIIFLKKKQSHVPFCEKKTKKYLQFRLTARRRLDMVLPVKKITHKENIFQSIQRLEISFSYLIGVKQWSVLSYL